jgi:hypothetical protein
VAAAGDHERARRLATLAEAIARIIIDPGDLARVLVEVAGVADPRQTNRLLGEAFAIGHWPLPLPLLAKLRPPLVIQIVDEIYGTERSRQLADGSGEPARADPA